MTAAADPVQPAYRVLQVGDPVHWFKQNSTSNPQFSFDTVAGRYVVLCFYGMGSDEVGRATLASFQEEHRFLFDDDKIALFGVRVDLSDQSENRARHSPFLEFRRCGRTPLRSPAAQRAAGPGPGSDPPLLDGAQPFLKGARHLPVRGGWQRPREGDGLSS